MGARPLEDLEVLVYGSKGARLFVQGAPMRLRLLEVLEVPVFKSKRARVFVPGKSAGTRPYQDLGGSPACRESAETHHEPYERCLFALKNTV